MAPYGVMYLVLALFRVKGFRLFGPKSLINPLLIYSQLDKNKYQDKYQNANIFI